MDDPSTATPVEVVRAYQEFRRGTHNLLDDLQRDALEGNHEDVRQRIRSFADQHRKPFFAVAYALSGNEDFFKEIKTKLDDGTARDLRELQKGYPSLVEPFHIVRMEISQNRRNPITSIDVQISYSEEEETPLVGYTVSSGDMKFHEHRGTPQEVLQTAGYFVKAANDSLETVIETDRNVNTDELSGLIDTHEHLESELNSLYDHIETLRGRPPNE